MYVAESLNIVLNLLLITFFVVVHSLMATEWCKLQFNSFGLMPIHRSLYNLVSSFVLQVCLLK